MRQDHMGKSRPDGVRIRVRQLITEESELLSEMREHRLRHELESLLILCCRLAFSDAQVSRVVEAVNRAKKSIHLPEQSLIGSVAESCCLRAFAAVQSELGAECAKFDPDDLDQIDDVGAKLRDVPVAAIVGRSGQVESFDLMLWLLLSSYGDGVRSAYLTARTIANMNFYKLGRAASFIETMDDLAMVYEDSPETREHTASDINRALVEFSSEHRVAWSPRSSIARPA